MLGRGSKLFSMETSRGKFQYNITADCGSNAYRCYKAIKEYPKRVEAALNALIQTLIEIGDFRQYFEDNSKKKDAVLSETEFI